MTDLKQFYLPKTAIIGYANKEKHWYFESGTFDVNENIVNLKPLTLTCIKNIANINPDNVHQKREILNEGILFHDNLTTIWFLKPSERFLYFRKDLKLKDKSYWLPGLVFRLNGKSLSVFAYKGVKRPDEYTKLFKAPFHNVNGGNICMGSAEVDTSGTANKRMENNTNSFFNSEFTHFNDHNPIKGNLNAYFKEADGKFPSKLLIPINKSIKHLL